MNLNPKCWRLFADTRHPKGQPCSKATMLDGRPVLRMMDPEYAATYASAVMAIPKGSRCHWCQEEGWHEGDLAWRRQYRHSHEIDPDAESGQ